MNASPATVRATVKARKAQRVHVKPVWTSSTPVPVVAEKPMLGPEEFTGPCGCPACEKWADCYYCDGPQCRGMQD